MLFACKQGAIENLCKRRLGIGADGIILLESSKKADVGMRIFNADGSEAEMCGNGIRCLMKYMLEIGMPEKPYSIEVYGSVLNAKYENDLVSVDLGAPTEIAWDMIVEGTRLHFLNTGVPHAVVFVENLSDVDIEAEGRFLRRHKTFTPRGTNATFVQILSPGRLIFSTYERGVEAETLACGTGAAAAAFAYLGREGTAIVENKNGENMSIRVDEQQRIHMIGPARLAYKGQFLIENN